MSLLADSKFSIIFSNGAEYFPRLRVMDSKASNDRASSLASDSNWSILAKYVFLLIPSVFY